ncbi:MAG TPA: hypothetical protein VNI20_11730 [Fimbriimonadaceae bacterium]|nr:hypothetical protein [Fimbriimonadaceae bacterium]
MKDKKDLENPGGGDLRKSLNGEGTGLPFYAFVDPSGKMIENSLLKKNPGDKGSNIGHPMQPNEIAWFMKSVRAAAPKMTDAEAKTLEDWLKAQKRD